MSFNESGTFIPIHEIGMKVPPLPFLLLSLAFSDVAAYDFR
jgi:hypothetical protein